MAKYLTLNALFTAIANSLRGKTGGSGKIVADDFPAMIDGLDTSGITPTGTKTITTNGTHDVTAYANAQVNVQTGITPTGTKSITANGTHDVTNFASAEVNVPVPSGYIKPSGSISITENKTFDVTNYASAVVNVPVPAEKLVVLPITITSDLGAGTNKNQSIVTGNDFVRQHYADEGFSGLFVPVSGASIEAANNVVTAVYQGNRPWIKTNNTYYGTYMTSGGASSTPNGRSNNYPINGTGYNVSLRVNSSGNVNLYVASSFTVKAGSYLLVLFCTD